MPNLVLIGGGHSHAIVLELLGRNPIPDLNLTLISDVEKTPYSGMLPGHVAGFYSYDETHIDLSSLSKFAGAKLCLDRAIGLDLEHNQVICACQSPISFDYLSIDIGSTPTTISVSGAKKYAIPAKPVPQFLDAWSKLLAGVKDNPTKSLAIIIVGGGAGGVELALNMHHRLFTQKGINSNWHIHLIHRGDKLLAGHNKWVSKRLKKILLQRKVKLHLNETVTEVLPHQVRCESGLNIESDYTFWVTQASAPDWIKESGLAIDAKGFILVEDTLQSVSHPHIFAAGDIASMINFDRPKAGVFAVRQGRPLIENWRRIVAGRPLKPYIPQKKYLALIGAGDKSAIASWGLIGWQSFLLWYLKDYIDRQFMNRFQLNTYR